MSPPFAGAEPSTTAGNRAAREQALAALAASPVDATGLIQYNAGTNLLVIGDDPAAVERAVRAVAATFQPSALVIIAADGRWQAPIAGATTWSAPRDHIDLSGWLGGFRLRLSSQGDGEAHFDQVLDLCESPLLGQELPPPGYLTADQASLESQLKALHDLVGQFEKPKYFHYNPDICAHGMKGATACTRCIDACPAAAITSLIDRVRVEPHLCQGGGACATACPSGAMTYRYPTVTDSLERIRRMLRAYAEAGGEAPVLLIHDTEAGAEHAAALLSSNDEAIDRLLPLAVEEIASLGLEAWLTALAYGASGVRLLGRAGIPQQSIATLNEQLRLGGAILTGMGYPADALDWLEIDQADPISTQTPPPGTRTRIQLGALMPIIDPARHAALGEKRQILYQAIDHLHAQSPNQHPSRARH